MVYCIINIIAYLYLLDYKIWLQNQPEREKMGHSKGKGARELNPSGPR
jgi:hypothetical protein